jgi:hypothetical protein
VFLLPWREHIKSGVTGFYGFFEILSGRWRREAGFWRRRGRKGGGRWVCGDDGRGGIFVKIV